MSQQYDIYKGVEPIGGKQTLKPDRKFEILAKDFTEVQQGVPLRLGYGRIKSAGVQMTPIFGFRNEKITTKTGKK